MHSSPLQGVLDHLRKLTDPTRVRELSDADLLERFRLRREEAAFTLLVQRHGPMVLALCRRVLGDAHEAEDAFQATFLVLVRNVGTIRKQQSLAAWLHGVASRIAHKARASSVRQRKRIGQAFQPNIHDDPSEGLAGAELRTALDEEIERLPTKYRMPLVLCYLADKTHEQAARELGWPKSSLTARLARARELLQRRLRQRGFTASAGVLAVLLTEQSGNAVVPSLLTLSTVRLTVQALSGQALAATASVMLADTFAKGSVVGKWAAALTLLATMGLATVIGPRMAAVGRPSPGVEPAPKAQAPSKARDAKAEPHKPRVDPLPEGIVARIGSGRMRHGGYVSTLSFTPDGKSLLSGGVGSLCIWDTATGKRRRRFTVNTDWKLGVNFTAAGIAVASADKAGIVTVQIFDPASGKVRRRVEMKERATSAPLTFSADGKRIAFTQGNTVKLCDAATGKEILRIPQRRPAADIAFAPDGKTIALSNFTYITSLHDTTTGKCVRELKRYFDNLLNINVFSAVFSPDGRLLASIANPIRREEEPGKIIIWDVKTGIERQRLKAPSGWLFCAAFSPDSRYLAMGGNRPEVVLWEVATGKEVRRYRSESPVGSIAFSRDGKTLAAAPRNGALRLWDVATGRILPASAD